MATVRVNGFELLEGQLERIGRPMIKQIVEAGSAAAARRMQERTESAGHGSPGRSRRATGDMLASIGRNEYREWLGGGAQDVYPLGEDRRGTRNATKAYVLNYGRGRRLRGDKFITGDDRAEEIVTQAMQEESDRLVEKLNG